MTTQDFMEKIVNTRLAHCKVLLETIKDKEYTKNNDKFYNFKRTAHIRGISIIEAWDGMMNKHLTSILDMIDNSKLGIMPNQILINDKITDLINYLLIYEGIISEIQDEILNIKKKRGTTCI